MKLPDTSEQWQTAVDAARGFLALDDARGYGLVRGGPEVNTERCEKILQLGAERGFRPSPGAIERLITELLLSAA
jgi:hypothetical protein